MHDKKQNMPPCPQCKATHGTIGLHDSTCYECGVCGWPFAPSAPSVEPEQPTDLEMAAHIAGVSMERVAELTQGVDPEQPEIVQALREGRITMDDVTVREPESCMHGMRPDQCRPCDYEPEPGTECPTCRQQVVASVSWVRNSHEDIVDAEQRAWLDATERAVRIVERYWGKQIPGRPLHMGHVFPDLLAAIRGVDDAR